ncbi:helix-turn-helix transcriptional regulator [Brevundimonas vesicularis]|uniref:helix-turn-helix transcriptional regulator n=1 Tax=Brevundimonas vesicularis TaxID=41276 RepID=UPI0038D46C08
MNHAAVNIRPLTGPTRLQSLIDAIGEQEFENELLSLLNETCGAEHCAIFGLDGLAPRELAAASLDGTNTAHACATQYLKSQSWRRDPTMGAARQQALNDSPSLIHLNIGELEDRELRDVIYARMSERLLLCGPSAAGRVALSILKSGNGSTFESSGVMDLERFATILLPILGKHATATWHRSRLLLALTSLEEIETCVFACPDKFPRRESQVCARIIYGMSSTGIALELGISEETVMTYRKRVYQRLGIATQRELLIWYVSQWARAPRQPFGSSLVQH